MSRARRLLVIAVAWALPVAWVAAALLAGPSDGTSHLPSDGHDRCRPLGRDGHRRARLRRARPCATGDVIRSRRRPDHLRLAGRERPRASRAVGDVVRYEVRRPAADAGPRSCIARRAPHPLPARRRRSPTTSPTRGRSAAAAGRGRPDLLAPARRPRPPGPSSPPRVLVPMALTASPFGLGAIDLAGGRGAWPHAGGEILCALGIGTALVAAVTLTGMPEPVQRHPVGAGRGLPRPARRLRRLGRLVGRRWPARTSRTRPGSRHC